MVFVNLSLKHTHTPTLECTQAHTECDTHPTPFESFCCFLQNFYKDINREGMYIRYLHSHFNIMCF